MRASLPTHDSIQEFEGARHDRMWDGMTLWLEGHTDSAAGAVYLLGYCVEVALKCAYFRVLGLQISDPITALELRAAQAKAVAYGITARTEAYHSVQFWCDLLREQRRAIGLPFESIFEQQLIDEVPKTGPRARQSSWSSLIFR